MIDSNISFLGVKYVIQKLLKKEKGDLAARIAVTAALQGRFYLKRLRVLAIKLGYVFPISWNESRMGPVCDDHRKDAPTLA